LRKTRVENSMVEWSTMIGVEGLDGGGEDGEGVINEGAEGVAGGDNDGGDGGGDDIMARGGVNGVEGGGVAGVDDRGAMLFDNNQDVVGLFTLQRRTIETKI